jgi:hypothetical protein
LVEDQSNAEVGDLEAMRNVDEEIGGRWGQAIPESTRRTTLARNGSAAMRRIQGAKSCCWPWSLASTPQVARGTGAPEDLHREAAAGGRV